MAHYRKVHIDGKSYEWCRISDGGFYVKGVGKHSFEDFGYTEDDLGYYGWDDELGYPPFGPAKVKQFILESL